MWQSKRRTNGAALALGQPPRARCPHVPRARTRRPCGQRAWDVPSHARECRASRACCLSSARTGAERQHAGADSASVTTEVTAMVQNDKAVLSRKKNNNAARPRPRPCPAPNRTETETETETKSESESESESPPPPPPRRFKAESNSDQIQLNTSLTRNSNN